MFLEIHDLNLFFDEKQILAIDEIQIEKGELVTLLGPSGCGAYVAALYHGIGTTKER